MHAVRKPSFMSNLHPVRVSRLSLAVADGGYSLAVVKLRPQPKQRHWLFMGTLVLIPSTSLIPWLRLSKVRPTVLPQ